MSDGDDGDDPHDPSEVQNLLGRKSSQPSQTEQGEQERQMRQGEQGSSVSQLDVTEGSGQEEQASQAEQTGQESRPEKLSDRHHKTVYLADAINEEIDDAVSWMQFYADREYDVELEKNRHCYPFVFVVGAERVEEMGIDAVLDRMREDDLFDDPPEA